LVEKQDNQLGKPQDINQMKLTTILVCLVVTSYQPRYKSSLYLYFECLWIR